LIIKSFGGPAGSVEDCGVAESDDGMTTEEHDKDTRKAPDSKQADAGGSEEELEEGKTAPFGWVSLIIIASLIVGTWFLIQRLTADAKMQDCVQSGRRNCAPIEDPGR
jgi:hypothetical protein